MPAILRNVAKTDTLETQRQKINLLAQDVYSIGSGGSDLSAGNIKLGDGTRVAPSLSFSSDNTLGIYKPAAKTIGYVSDGRKIADFAPAAFYSFRDLILQRKVLTTSGTSIINNGSNYDAGLYSNVNLVGGTGDGATANITISAFSGTTTNQGKNYKPGSYSSVSLLGGTGSGSTVSFTVEPITGNITNPGSSYPPGAYTDVPLTGGSGSGAKASITITGNTTLNGSISNAGSTYTNGTYNFVPVLNKPTQTFVITTISNPGTPPPSNVYRVDGVTQQSLTLIRGNTYRFDMSSSSNAGHPLTFLSSTNTALSTTDYIIVSKGTAGSAGAFVDLTIKPTASTGTIKYDCTVHPGMGGTITVTSGTAGVYGDRAFATVIVSGNVVTSFVFSSVGEGYKSGDIVQIYNGDIGGTGSGFEYTLSTPTYTGVVSTVTITDSGSSYLKNDVLSINNTSVGGYGSGFSYTVTSDPGIIKNLTFTQKGTGYTVNDTLNLPSTVTGVSADLKGNVEGVSTTLSTASKTITVSSTSNIIPGMTVVVSGGTGSLPPNTTVASITNSTQLVLSNFPTGNGSATLAFSSSGNLAEITVASTIGIYPGFLVSKTSGNGSLAANTTVINVNSSTNTLTLSNLPTSPGSAVLSFAPPYGVGSPAFAYRIDTLGSLDSFTIINGGNGYSTGDQLTVDSANLVQPIQYNVKNQSIQKITFQSTLPANTFTVGSFIKKRDGGILTFTQTSSPTKTPTLVSGKTTTLSTSSSTITVSSTTGIVAGMIVSQDIRNDVGRLANGTTVQQVLNGTQIVLSATPTTSGSAILDFTSNESGTYTGVASTTSGSGSSATFNIVRNVDGTIASVNINSSGYSYATNDTVTIAGNLIGGTSPTHNITLNITSVSSTQNLEIFEVKTSGGNISSLTVANGSLLDGDTILKSPAYDTPYVINTASASEYRYFIDSGSGYALTPNLTFYVGNTYLFNTSDSSNTGHVFALSKYRDGIWSPSYIQNISTTLSTTSPQISVTNTSGILPGMTVSVTSGTGTLLSRTTVLTVNNSTTITLSDNPVSSGSVVLSFRGVEYTENVTRAATSLKIKVTSNTPNLYYYCASSSNSHQNEGGDDNLEALITINSNNPKVFGSGLSLSVAELDSSDIIKGNISTGEISSTSILTTDVKSDTATINSSLSVPSIQSTNIVAQSLLSTSNLSISASNIIFAGNINLSTYLQINGDTGNITTSGIIKSTNSFNSNDKLLITNNIISSTTGNNVLITPATGRVAKINTTSALTIPSGTTAQRPAAGIVENGSIRFNTQTGQYEGYSSSTSSWSSLGGVRDLDGNTYIAAEATIGANDNTLYFYNDNNNTVKLTTTELAFNTVKNIHSLNTLAPSSTLWSANTPVTLGQYVNYGFNVYEVTGAGTTAGSANPPTHTTGAASNGTAQLTWNSSYVDVLTFSKVSQVNIGTSLIPTTLVINGGLKLFDDTVSTITNDLVLQPYSGKKVTINATTSLVIPAGDTSQRGIPSQGSIRYSTTLSSFEGYNGTNWTSLGGVKDVDGNTYIIPETSPGANENILYFYNNGSNTLRVTESALQFRSIDAISSLNNNLDLEVQTVTFNNLSFTVDNTGSTTTKLLSTRTNLDFALSSGVTSDPLLRLNSTGDILVNKSYSTGSNTFVKVLDNELKTFELDDVKIETSDLVLTKGSTEFGLVTIFTPSVHSGAKVILIADNVTTNDREVIEYNVVSKNGDIYHTEYGNVTTGLDLISTAFDFDGSGNVRLTPTLISSLSSGNIVNITVIKTIFKK